MTTHRVCIDWLGRPILVNGMNKLTPMARHTQRKLWRKAGKNAQKVYHVPPMTQATFDVQARYPDRRSLPDPDGCQPAFKAILDGLVDAKVLPNDTGAHVMWIRYWPPLISAGPPALLVTITDVSIG